MTRRWLGANTDIVRAPEAVKEWDFRSVLTIRRRRGERGLVERVRVRRIEVRSIA